MNYKSFNDQSLRLHFRGDEAILLDMINIFQDKYLTQLLETTRGALLNHDSGQLKINAHTFKGVLGSFYSEIGRQLAYELEICGKESRFEDGFVILNKLENFLMLLSYELNFFKEQLDEGT